ncbi:MAG TPA: glycosyltransferase [Solirubrobacteraceae bacterium]
MRVAFDSRPGADTRSVGHYARCLLRALRDTAGERDEILETHRPRSAEVFHAPWLEGAMLRSPCPMVVTIHDVVAFTRPSERLRCGGVHLHLRHLALQRATHVIVPTEVVACEAVSELGLEREHVVVIPAAPEPVAYAPCQPAPPVLPRTWEDVGRETWRVYEDARTQPKRACVAGSSRRLGARAPRGPSSAGL